MVENARVEDLSGVRVLVLGLHPHLSRWVLEDLSRFGVMGDNATSPKEAIEKASDQHFDALLVGGGMTGGQANEAYVGMKKHLPNLGFNHRGISDGLKPIDHLRNALSVAATSDAKVRVRRRQTERDAMEGRSRLRVRHGSQLPR